MSKPQPKPARKLPRARVICPMCETFGCGPCDECDRLNRPVRKRKKIKAPKPAFASALDAAIEFHRNNKCAPYGIGNAVMIALVEVRNAYLKSLNLPTKCPPNQDQTNQRRR